MPIVDAVITATSVHRSRKPYASMELRPPKVCISHAHPRAPRGVRTMERVMGPEELVGEARARHPRRMSSRERTVVGLSTTAFLSTAVGLALFLPSERATEPFLLVGLVLGYALISRVRFEFGNWFVVPEALAFVPLLLLAPLPFVPLLVALQAALSMLPDLFDGSRHRERVLTCSSDCWFTIGPVLVLAAFAPGEASIANAGVYVAALVAQFVSDFAWT